MLHGVINVYKEQGFTSHDVVAKLRGILGQRKIGHTGTLDPDAKGVLPVCLGKATKLCNMLTEKDKTYEAILLLGKTTDTQDISGTVLSEFPTEHLVEQQVIECILGFQGKNDQIPPMYSALKVNGKKLYELARQGIEVERKAREIYIHSIVVEEIELPRVKIKVNCSKGTYIRTLCHDIGMQLGCGGVMEALLRTKVERFEIADSVTLTQIEERKQKESLESLIYPIDQMFAQYKTVTILEKYAPLVYNGNPFAIHQTGSSDTFKQDEQVRVYDYKGVFIGIYRFQADRQMFQIMKMFYGI